MSILLVRHGETALNVARVLQPADTPLSARGVAQARLLAQRLAALGVAGVLSSDLPRALQTAALVAAATGTVLETSPLLHERNFGDLRGRARDSLSFNPMTMRDAPPGGESTADFQQRVALAFALVVQRCAALAGTLAVVTHGLVIRQMLDAHGCLADGQVVPAHLGNTSVCVLDALPPHGVRLLDCTRHLDALSQDDANALSGG